MFSASSGTLTPGATYIYEQVDGVTYARESGADPSTRRIVGMTLEASNLRNQMRNNQLWHDIRRAAETNPSIQRALDQCIILYRLSKEYEDIYGNRKT
jgi:hypothetical protein